MRAFSVALHHLPVGHMVTIKNAQPIPEKLHDEHGHLDWQVSDLYHGTSATLVPRIMGQGLLPTIGAGSQHLQEQYGRPVPGVYVAKDWIGRKPISDPAMHDGAYPPGQEWRQWRIAYRVGRDTADEGDYQMFGKHQSPALA